MSDYDFEKERSGGQENSPDQGKSPPDAYGSPWGYSGSSREDGGWNPYDSYGAYDTRRGDGSRGGPAGSQPPYQYSTTGGWQQSNRPQERYQWNYSEYDRAMPGKKKGRKNRGVVVFAVSLLCVLSISLLALTGYNIVKTLSQEDSLPSEPAVQPGFSESVSQSMPTVSPGDDVSMNITGKPQISEPEPVIGEKMTIPQVARAVRPTVVGVVNYQSGQIFEPYTEGSGIIVSQDGYIVTNEHVVAGAEAVVIVFDDDTEYEAALVGSDARTDLAVLKVDRNDLVPAILGNSNELEVGETVIAIGNPGGTELAGSVTQGIVSAVNRVVKTPYYSTNYIQTDAAINPGNSGGALCNEFGQVVGINSAKIVAEGYEGISFAIPISEAVPIIEDLIAHGRVTGRVLLGITGDPVSEVIARNRNVPAGVQIMTITSQELTDKGVMRGDIITHIDDERVLDLNDVRSIIESHRAGDVVKLTLYRQTRVNTNSNTFEVEVSLIEDTGE